MAAIIKKRALAEYSHVIQEEKKPVKKFRLVKRAVSDNVIENEIGMLKAATSSNESFAVLLRISEAFPIEVEEGNILYSLLLEQIVKEEEPAVRAKIISLLGDIVLLLKQDPKKSTDDFISILKSENSHAVIKQAVVTLLKLGKQWMNQPKYLSPLIQFAKLNLGDTNHLVQSRCIQLIGELSSISQQSEQTVKLVIEYTSHQDPRVRTAALEGLLRLHERKLKLGPAQYLVSCNALNDDYEMVRKVALQLVFVLSQDHSEHLITIEGSKEQIRLVDDAFAKVCNAINDLSVSVRTLAAQILGKMTDVSQRFLEQTLDKKLMSNMRRKYSAHERQMDLVVSGEWATGKKWADDAPKEFLSAEAISLISTGACGAFVHGLEDEFMEVRLASVESLCQLTVCNPPFALLSLDFLVDMFNDEIEEVRLKAIYSLKKISEYIILREDQLETILAVLEDFSLDSREGLHELLSACRLSTKAGLKMCIDNLLENLKRYPQDRRSIWRCLKHLGSNHPELTLMLVPELLTIHPYFDAAEPDVEDPAYTCILILILNAAQKCDPMLPLLEKSTLRHYYYLRDSLPSLVPSLKLNDDTFEQIDVACSLSKTTQFLQEVLIRLRVSTDLESSSLLHLQSTAFSELVKIAEIEPGLCAAASFASLYVKCQMLFSQIVANPTSWTIALQHKTNTRSLLERLLHCTVRLSYMFSGLSKEEIGVIRQLRLKVLFLNLVYIVRGSNTSALAICEHVMEEADRVQKFLINEGLERDPVVESIFKELENLEDAKPGVVVRSIESLLYAHRLPPLTLSSEVKMASAVIYDPTSPTELALKFTAGLILGVPFDCEVQNIPDIRTLRIKVKYPDQQVHLIVPNLVDLRPIGTDNSCYRLLTTVLISHQVWSEACHVEVGLVINLSEMEETYGTKQEDLYTIELCKPVKVYVCPKSVRKGL